MRNPASAYQRFARGPSKQLLGVFDQLIDRHVALAACDSSRSARPATVAAFADAWRRERTGMTA